MSREFHFWTYQEIELLKVVFPNHAVSWKGLEAHFPRHPIESIRRKARDLGLTRPNSPKQRGTFKHIKWTFEEDEKLQALRAQGLEHREISQYFPDRSHESIRKRWGLLNKSAEEREHANRRLSERRQEKRRMRGLKRAPAMVNRNVALAVPDQIIAERNERLSAPLRSHPLLGDPPVGYSALDKKMELA